MELYSVYYSRSQRTSFISQIPGTHCCITSLTNKVSMGASAPHIQYPYQPCQSGRYATPAPLPSPHLTSLSWLSPAHPKVFQTHVRTPSTSPGISPSYPLANQQPRKKSKFHRFPRPRSRVLGLSLGEIRCLVRPTTEFSVAPHPHPHPHPSFVLSPALSQPRNVKKMACRAPRKPFKPFPGR